MDRKTIYFGQNPLETDLLTAEQFAMTAIGTLAQTAFGTNVLVDGLSVVPTGPASLNVTLNPGSVYQIEDLEASTWSSLNANTSSQIVKQGISLLPAGGSTPAGVGVAATIGITPPGTTGFSQSFLVEVQYADLDGSNVVLPYYNPANPAAPFSGPGDSGDSQATVRYGCTAYQVKAGTAAVTGTQTVPTPDAGWTGIYVITLANGAASITSGNITMYAGAPFLQPHGKLPAIPIGVQNNEWRFAADTGTASALAVTLAPAPEYPFVEGFGLVVKVANNGTGPSTISVNGNSPVSIVHGDSTALVNLDLRANGVIGLYYDGTHFQLAWRGNGAFFGIIDTQVTYTVGGGTPSILNGVPLTDLNTAFQVLAGYMIVGDPTNPTGTGGQVTLALPIGQFSYGSNYIECVHPNSNRIIIKGANLSANPTSSTFAVTGSSSGARTSDRATILANLRSCYSTEIQFTGSAALQTFSDGLTIENLLITGDRTGAVTSQLLYNAANTVNLINVSVHGGANGIGSNTGSLLFTDGVVSATGCVDAGFNCAGQMQWNNSAVYANNNDQNGISVSGGVWTGYSSSMTMEIEGNGSDGVTSSLGGYCALPTTSTIISTNGGNGISSLRGGRVQAQNVTVSSNGGYGCLATNMSLIFCIGGSFSVNSTGPVYADFNSLINATGATPSGLSGASPAVNTSGNANSYIAN